MWIKGFNEVSGFRHILKQEIAKEDILSVVYIQKDFETDRIIFIFIQDIFSDTVEVILRSFAVEKYFYIVHKWLIGGIGSNRE